MKKLIYVIYLFLICSCTACEGLSDILHIYNNSDEAIYVHFQCGKSDSLPIAAKLELFHFFDNKSFTDASGHPIPPSFGSPDYRINAYSVGTLHGRLEGRVLGKPKKPRFPCKENWFTLFFITEKTMREYNWEEIHKNQMYVKKTTLTKEELENKNWIITYP